jgi:hypothetical protein
MGKTLMIDDAASANDGEATGATPPARTRGLRPGDPNFGRERRPPLPERLGRLAGAVLGEAEGAFIYAVLESVRRKQVPASIANELIRRVLPERPPADISTLPAEIRTPRDWLEAIAELWQLRRASLLTDDEHAALLKNLDETWRRGEEARIRIRFERIRQ